MQSSAIRLIRRAVAPLHDRQLAALYHIVVIFARPYSHRVVVISCFLLFYLFQVKFDAALVSTHVYVYAVYTCTHIF